MRSSTVAVLCLATAWLACKTEPSSETSTTNNTNATVNTGPARNGAAVNQFRDEAPSQPLRKLAYQDAAVRSAPAGNVMAVFRDDQEVTEVARQGDWSLITCNNPDGSGRTLTGWMYKDSLAKGEAYVGPAAHIQTQASRYECKSGEVHVVANGVCGTACKQDADCTLVGGVCDGRGLVTSGNGVTHASYCVARSP